MKLALWQWLAILLLILLNLIVFALGILVLMGRLPVS
jgi:hypothetical protein